MATQEQLTEIQKKITELLPNEEDTTEMRDVQNKICDVEKCMDDILEEKNGVGEEGEGKKKKRRRRRRRRTRRRGRRRRGRGRRRREGEEEEGEEKEEERGGGGGKDGGEGDGGGRTGDVMSASALVQND